MTNKGFELRLEDLRSGFLSVTPYILAKENLYAYRLHSLDKRRRSNNSTEYLCGDDEVLRLLNLLGLVK